MRPMLSAVVVALVLLTAAFLFVGPVQDRASPGTAHASGGLTADVPPSYFISLSFSTVPVLAAYHDTLNYAISNDTTGAPFQGLTTITILGTYYNTLNKLLPLPGTPINVSTAPIGSFTFLVPANSSTSNTHEPTLTLYANDTTLHMNNLASRNLQVGTLQLINPRVCTVTNTCGVLTTGEPAIVSATTDVHALAGSSAPAVGEIAKFTFYSTGSSPVTVPGVPSSVTTDGSGYAAVTFTPVATIFNVPGPNHVEIEVSDTVNTSLAVFANVTFTLLNPTGTSNFAFSLNAGQYYSGQTVTASWQWAGTNGTVGVYNVTNYDVYDASTGNLLASGLIGSTSPTGSFSFALPSTYVGTFDVWAYLHNATRSASLEAVATSSQALLDIVPSEYYYSAGDTITVIVTTAGPAISGATISAYVEATNSGQSLFNGTVSGGSFQFTIPKVAPASSYVIGAWAATTTSGTIASTTARISAASGYTFWAGVSTASSYTDGSFNPGQSVQISYKLVSFGTSPLPTLQFLAIFPGDCGYTCSIDTPALKEYTVTSSTGSVSFTIPSSSPNGLQTFTVVQFSTLEGESAIVTINVNSSPSPLNYELGAGSGLTVGWLILLLLIVIIVLAVMVIRRRGGGRSMIMSHRGPSSAEWKEPPAQSSGSSGSPPSGRSGDTPSTPSGPQ